MKKKDALFSLFAFFFLFIVIPALGSGLDNRTEKPRHRIPGISSKVKVDGILNEKVWQEALVLELNYEVEPGENIKPPVKTEVLLAYNDNRLYVAFRAYDPNPSEIRARFTDRDKIWEDDYVGIVLDTFNDSRHTFNFYCNPYGIQADRIVSMLGGGNQWDTIWNSAGRINRGGYIVEMAIPFSSLRFQRQKRDQVWGIDAISSYPRNLNHRIGLFPRDRSNNCYMCEADKIIGFSGARPGKNIELDPTLSTLITQERDRFPDGKFVEKRSNVDPGLTARWGFTPNLTLSATINPDFSNVEADAAQLDINTQFALYFPEKRPFFLEGASIFNTRFSIIHTRSVADPNCGIKLTGKEGTNAIGFFFAQDSNTNLIFPGSQSSQSTSLETNNFSSQVVGIDGDLRITKKDRIMLLFLGSQIRYTDQIAIDYDQPRGKLGGTALDLFYVHQTENLGYSDDYFGYRDIPLKQNNRTLFLKIGYALVL